VSKYNRQFQRNKSIIVLMIMLCMDLVCNIGPKVFHESDFLTGGKE
jgi:hypothetical protein